MKEAAITQCRNFSTCLRRFKPFSVSSDSDQGSIGRRGIFTGQACSTFPALFNNKTSFVHRGTLGGVDNVAGIAIVETVVPHSAACQGVFACSRTFSIKADIQRITIKSKSIELLAKHEFDKWCAAT